MGDAFEMAGDVDEADVDQMYDQILEEVGLEVVEGGAVIIFYYLYQNRLLLYPEKKLVKK
jgi:hypothetical protein